MGDGIRVNLVESPTIASHRALFFSGELELSVIRDKNCGEEAHISQVSHREG